jgi:hypothetical protein
MLGSLGKTEIGLRVNRRASASLDLAIIDDEPMQSRAANGIGFDNDFTQDGLGSRQRKLDEAIRKIVAPANALIAKPHPFIKLQFIRSGAGWGARPPESHQRNVIALAATGGELLYDLDYLLAKRAGTEGLPLHGGINAFCM